jgi:hypothetical protein
MGQTVPWRDLNYMIKLADIMNPSARNIYATKRRQVHLGDNMTVKQVGDGKDINRFLSAYNVHCHPFRDCQP